MEFPGVPGGDNKASAVGIFFDVLDNAFDLVDRVAVWCFPVSPLRAINAAEVAVFIRPFIPDRNVVFAQIADVCVTFKEPEEFVDDGAEVEFFCGEKRESLIQIKSFLGAKDRIGAGAGAIAFESSFFQNESKKAVILFHAVILRQDLQNFRQKQARWWVIQWTRKAPCCWLGFDSFRKKGIFFSQSLRASQWIRKMILKVRSGYLRVRAARLDVVNSKRDPVSELSRTFSSP